MVRAIRVAPSLGTLICRGARFKISFYRSTEQKYIQRGSCELIYFILNGKPRVRVNFIKLTTRE